MKRKRFGQKHPGKDEKGELLRGRYTKKGWFPEKTMKIGQIGS